MNTGIVCSCIPAIRALLKLKLPDRLKSMGTSSSGFTSARTKLNTTTSGASDHGKVIYGQAKKATTRSVHAAVEEVYLDKPLPLLPERHNSETLATWKSCSTGGQVDQKDVGNEGIELKSMIVRGTPL